MSRKGPTGLRPPKTARPPLAAPDRVSKTQVRLTDHELQIGGEGIPASVRRGPIYKVYVHLHAGRNTGYG
jgi:hypothetical protein